VANDKTARSLPTSGLTNDELVDAYLRRASERVAPASTPARRDTRDFVYSGTMLPPPRGDEPVAAPRRNRAGTRRKVSPFSIVIGLLLTAVASVLYISNVIAIGQLMGEIGALENRQQRLSNEQELLRAQISRMSSLERIRQISETDLGMRNSETLPGWLTVDPERVAELEALVRKAQERP